MKIKSEKSVYQPVPELDNAIALEAIDYLARYARPYLDALVESLNNGRSPAQIRAYLVSRLPDTKATLIRHVYNAATWISENGLPEDLLE